jgi:hypothetical protein
MGHARHSFDGNLALPASPAINCCAADHNKILQRLETLSGSAKRAQALATAARERGQQHAGAGGNLRADRERAAEKAKGHHLCEHSASYKASN